MRRALRIVTVVVGSVAAIGLLAAPAVLATAQTASAGNVTATFTFQGKIPHFHGERLAIARNGTVVYDRPVVTKFCGKLCWPGSTADRHSSVQVIDLEHNGEPDVVLNLYSGGAHCCFVAEVYSFDPATSSYVQTERNFGDPGERIVDLRHDGRFEFLTADDSFAYRFTDYAASGLPIEILTFANRHFTDVTRSYPKLVAKDAMLWMKAFKRMARDHYSDSVGVVAAWAADEYLLGHRKLVSRFLARQLKLGHLNAPSGHSGKRFVSDLKKFLRQRGYAR